MSSSRSSSRRLDTTSRSGPRLGSRLGSRLGARAGSPAGSRAGFRRLLGCLAHGRSRSAAVLAAGALVAAALPGLASSTAASATTAGGGSVSGPAATDPRGGSAQTKLVTDNPADNTPNVLDGEVDAIVQAGSRIILGGQFTKVSTADGKTTYDRSNIVAFDASTGAIDQSFAPKIDDKVTALQVAADGKSVYAGGFFKNVGSAPAQFVARINLADGTLAPGFAAPKLNGKVKDLRLVGNRLWVAGAFGYVGDKKQAALASLNATTGAFDAYDRLTFAGPYRGGALQVMKIDVTPDGHKLVAIGNFSTVQGASRPQLAMLDLSGTTAALADWQTSFYEPNCSAAFDSYMRDLDISPDGKYVVITTTGAWGGANSPCDTSSRWELGQTGSNLKATWVDYTGGDTTYAVEITGAAVYVGGHFRWQNNPNTTGDRAGGGAVGREGIAVLDPSNGLPYDWNPGRTKGVGVFDILATSTGLWVGSDTDRIGHYEYHGRIAYFPLAGGKAIPRPAIGTIPGDIYTTGAVPGGIGPVKRYADGTTFAADQAVPAGGIDWNAVRGGFMLGDMLHLGHSDGSLTSQSFDGSAYGSSTTIDTADQIVRDAPWHSDLANVSGLAVSGGRMYYTVAGQPYLYYRYLTLESNVVGATRFVASGNVSGVNFADVSGMFITPGTIWWGSRSDGNLRKASFSGGTITPGTVTTVSGPSIDGRSWKGRMAFVYSGSNRTAVAQPPAPDPKPAPTAKSTPKPAPTTKPAPTFSRPPVSHRGGQP